MKKEIVKKLFEAEDYISGEALSEILGVSRAAVWKHIKAMETDGCAISAQTGKGYRLTKIADVLKEEYVSLYMDETQSMIWLDTVDSTNNAAKKYALEGKEGNTFILAEHQSGGKGRLGHAWEDERGEAVLMSCLLRPHIAPKEAPAITFAAALGTMHAIEDVSGVKAQIKWPNDIVFDGRKISGILTEMAADIDHIEYVVVGIGTNVNQESFDDELKNKAVSLQMLTGQPINRPAFCAALMKRIREYTERFVAEGLGGLMEEYSGRSAVLGKEIRIVGLKETVYGTCVGFGSSGSVLVETDDGVREFSAGEVSLRSMDSYV